MKELIPVKLEINGVLDLHNFRPGEIKDLVMDYLDACKSKGILEVRIIHGKGSGTLRRTVHATLDKISYVQSYSMAGDYNGSWGATIVYIYK